MNRASDMPPSTPKGHNAFRYLSTSHSWYDHHPHTALSDRSERRVPKRSDQERSRKRGGTLYHIRVSLSLGGSVCCHACHDGWLLPQQTISLGKLLCHTHRIWFIAHQIRTSTRQTCIQVSNYQEDLWDGVISRNVLMINGETPSAQRHRRRWQSQTQNLWIPLPTYLLSLADYPITHVYSTVAFPIKPQGYPL